MIQTGAPFPQFELSDQEGKIHSNESLKGSLTVVYFYPKDSTPGCTTEACEFQESLPSLANVKVIGVSPDSVASHGKFAGKFGLGFPLLADTDHALAESLGVWGEKSMYGKKYMGVLRTTFVLDADGKILKIFESVKPQGHAAEVKTYIDSLSQ